MLFTTNGCDSTVTTNLTVKPNSNTTQSPVLCAGQSITVGTSVYSISGTYTDILTAANGCDSTVTTFLTINPSISTATTVSGITITASASGAAYSWLDCGTNLLIPSETSQSFTPATNGMYAAVIIVSGCSDTSACETIISVGIDAASMSTIEMLVYPNPSNGEFTVETVLPARIIIYNALGEIVKDEMLNSGKHIVSLENQSSGVYLLKAIAGNGQKLIRISKQ